MYRPRNTFPCVTAAILFLAVNASPLFAQTGATPDLMEHLSSSDYQERHKATQAAENAIISNGISWLTSEDDDTNAEVTKIQQFSQRFSLLMVEATRWPLSTREPVLKFLQSPALMTIRTQLFSPVPEDRAQGVKALAKIQDPSVDMLLAFFLRDDAIMVKLATMEGVWDRPATETVVSALWDIAIGEQLGTHKKLGGKTNAANAGPALMFRGQPLAAGGGATLSVVSAYGGNSTADAQAALDTLAHLKGPLVESRLNQALKTIADRLNDPNKDDETSFFIINPMLNALCKLGESCAYKSTIPAFYQLATVRLTTTHEMRMGVLGGGAGSYMSVRTMPLVTTLKLTSQDPQAYDVSEGSTGFAHGWHFASREDEQKAVEHLQSWWQKNSSSRGVATN